MLKGKAYANPNKNKCANKLVKTEFKDFENEPQKRLKVNDFCRKSVNFMVCTLYLKV